MNSLVSPPRNGTTRLSSSQSVVGSGSPGVNGGGVVGHDARTQLPRRFTTDSGRVPTLSSLAPASAAAAATQRIGAGAATVVEPQDFSTTPTVRHADAQCFLPPCRWIGLTGGCGGRRIAVLCVRYPRPFRPCSASWTSRNVSGGTERADNRVCRPCSCKKYNWYVVVICPTCVLRQAAAAMATGAVSTVYDDA